jgi:ectoine hydroxylase-related dioxygenase (phytanoyl-CoA dioxygenase family)
VTTGTATLPRLHATDPIDDVVAALTEHGAVIVEHMITGGCVDAIVGEVSPFLDAADPAMTHLNPVIQAFFGDRTRHVASLSAKSPTFVDEVLLHPTLVGICDEVLLPSCARYQLNLGHLIARGPGAQAQYLHHDEDVWIHVPRPHPELQVATMTALVDFTVETGATRVVPGSHRWERDRAPAENEIVDAEMPAGSTVVYLGSTIHGAGTNSSDDVWRLGVHLSYTLGWLRTEENNYLGTPPTVARTLPRRAQELLGYAVHDAIDDLGGYLGMVELRDPVELMERGELG